MWEKMVYLSSSLRTHFKRHHCGQHLVGQNHRLTCTVLLSLYLNYIYSYVHHRPANEVTNITVEVENEGKRIAFLLCPANRVVDYQKANYLIGLNEREIY